MADVTALRQRKTVINGWQAVHVVHGACTTLGKKIFIPLWEQMSGETMDWFGQREQETAGNCGLFGAEVKIWY